MLFAPTVAEMQMAQGLKFKGKTANAAFLCKFWGRSPSPGTRRVCRNDATTAGSWPPLPHTPWDMGHVGLRMQSLPSPSSWEEAKGRGAGVGPRLRCFFQPFLSCFVSPESRSVGEGAVFLLGREIPPPPAKYSVPEAELRPVGVRSIPASPLLSIPSSSSKAFAGSARK